MNSKKTYKQLFEDYEKYREREITSKFVPHNLIKNLIKKLPDKLFTVTELGKSVEGKSIFSIKIGTGKIKVLAWSQMHGNESTATMALFDIFNFFSSNDAFNNFRETIFSNLSLYFVPMLNPDGAEKFKRENTIGIDLNRDAIKLTSPEAIILKKLHEKIKPDFGFNLHDQDNKYTVGKSSKSAVISFLAPPFNYKREINSIRKKTMQVIAKIYNVLSEFIPEHIGKYSDEFEPRAFGDNFVKWGTSSVLIETGGWGGDNEKQFQRKLNFIAIFTGLYSIATKNYEKQAITEYQNIKENEKFLFNVFLKNLNYSVNEKLFHIDLGINSNEKLDTVSNLFYYVSEIEEIGDLTGFSGYSEIDCSGMTVELGKVSDESFSVNTEFTEEQLLKFYHKGIIFLKTNSANIKKKYSNCGINFVTTAKFINKLEIGTCANFVIKLKGKIVFVVINGFVYNLQKKTGQVKNGIIIH